MLIKATFECGRWNHNGNEYAHNDYAYDGGDDDDDDDDGGDDDDDDDDDE